MAARIGAAHTLCLLGGALLMLATIGAMIPAVTAEPQDGDFEVSSVIGEDTSV